MTVDSPLLARGHQPTETYLVAMKGYLQNHVLIILKEANRQGILPRNPAISIGGLGGDKDRCWTACAFAQANRCSACCVYQILTVSEPVQSRVLWHGPTHVVVEGIGITAEKRKERNIVFHSHRHFLNSILRNARVPDFLVQRVTGSIGQKALGREPD
jgi:hypothetical protein